MGMVVTAVAWAASRVEAVAHKAAGEEREFAAQGVRG